MKKTMLLAMILCTASAFGWNCTTPGQVRVQVPTGTRGNGTGDGSGQVVVDSGLTFICEALPVPVTTPPSTNNNTNSATSAANATSGSASKATATGGNATAGVSNSGNSTNTINNSLNQKQKQQQQQNQTQSNSSTNSNQSAGGSVTDVGNSVTTVEAPKIPVASAYAPPVFSTTNCFKGYSAGAQTPLIGGSFGGGGIDKNCAALATAQNLYAMGSHLAACKVIVTTKAAKDAGVTMEDCMTVPQRQAPVVIAPPAPLPAPEPVQVNVYFPAQPVPVVVAPKPLGDVKPRTAKHVSKPCKVTTALQTPMEK
jgi:hypothetical protein